MGNIEKFFLIFWPGVVAIAYAFLALDGVWRHAMLSAMAITYIAVTPMIVIAYLQDKRAAAQKDQP